MFFEASLGPKDDLYPFWVIFDKLKKIIFQHFPRQNPTYNPEVTWAEVFWQKIVTFRLFLCLHMKFFAFLMHENSKNIFNKILNNAQYLK